MIKYREYGTMDEVEKADMVVDVLAAGVLARDPVNELVHVPQVIINAVNVEFVPQFKLVFTSLLERLLKSILEIGVLG